MKILVTGANGNLGKLLATKLQQSTHEIFEASSTPLNTQRLLNLKKSFSRDLLVDIELVVHCARGKNARDLEQDKNFIRMCRDRRIGVVYIGSLSSWLDTSNNYGKYKKEVEDFVILNDGTVVTCGLIYGDGYMGQIYVLNKFLKFIPFYLDLPETKDTFLTPVDALFREIMSQIENRQVGKRILLVHRNAIEFNRLIHLLARRKYFTVKLKKKMVFAVVDLFGSKIQYFNSDSLNTIYSNYKPGFKAQFIDKSVNCGDILL